MKDGSGQAGRLTLPVNLLAEDWHCLVAGGGNVALRKVKGLLSSGAAVRVVSPDLCPELEALAAAGTVEHARRRFEASDAAGMRLVFAATDDRGANRAILRAARAAGALCCCVDGNWGDGDFVTPAALQREGLTVAVSTGGRSCRRARLVKDTLNRHIRSIDTAQLLVIGTSHDELSLEERESVQLVGAGVERAGDMLMQVWGIHEFMLLITCNRVELAAIASDDAGAGGLPERILGFEHLREDQWYRMSGYSAFEHMALVAGGMCSQSPGEYHVAAQVKDALDTARRRGWADSGLQAWMDAALHISKHIKKEVTPLLHCAEIEEVSIEYIAERLGGDWSGWTVLVLGTGAMGRALVERSLDRNSRCVWCYHVNRPRPDPAWGDRVRLISFNEIKDVLAQCQVMFCAFETAAHVLHHGHAPFFDQERRVAIMDLGVPRNVDPALAPLLPEAELINLDRLKSWAARKYGNLDRALQASRGIVERHKDEYESIIERLQGRNQTQ